MALVTEIPESYIESLDYHKTDWGNAQRFAVMHGEQVRYCHHWGKWLLWDGKRWVIDTRGKIVSLAKETVRMIYSEAAIIEEDKARKELAAHALKSESDARINAMLDLARSEPGIPISPDDFDTDPWLLNVENGVLHLKDGTLTEHDPDLYMTKLAPVAYDPEAQAPVWEACLAKWMASNQDMVDFLARAVGYSMTGHVGEECMFLPWGSGRNGKSKFIGAIESILGDYSKQAHPETFTVKRDQGISNDIASLRGIRFAPTIETEESRRLAEALIKHITGGDTIKARFLYQEFFEFAPSFKIWLVTNHKPIIWGTDTAIWERIHLIPFSVYIPPEERDRNLGQKLDGERPGILNWALRGCLEWQKTGLRPPEQVIEATEGYRRDMDTLGTWIGDRCVLEPDIRASNIDLWTNYVEWCEEEKENPMPKRTFGKRLEEKGYKPFRTARTRGHIGIRPATIIELSKFTEKGSMTLDDANDATMTQSKIGASGPSDDTMTQYVDKNRARARACDFTAGGVIASLASPILNTLSDGMARSADLLAGQVESSVDEVRLFLESEVAAGRLEKRPSSFGSKDLYRIIGGRTDG